MFVSLKGRLCNVFSPIKSIEKKPFKVKPFGSAERFLFAVCGSRRVLADFGGKKRNERTEAPKISCYINVTEYICKYPEYQLIFLRSI